MNVQAVTAASMSLVNCHECGRLNPAEPAKRGRHPSCPRCGAALHARKPNSINRTWALVITALILYIPANLYPVMTVQMMGKGDPHTIFGGVVELFHAESYACGILVLFASVTVPLMKMLGISYLLLSIQFGWHARPRDRTKLYRIIEIVGRWSMLDIFMISILTALVNVGALAHVEPGPAATYFAAVVILTMIAAASFDPRLIWDSLENDR